MWARDQSSFPSARMEQLQQGGTLKNKYKTLWLSYGSLSLLTCLLWRKPAAILWLTLQMGYLVTAVRSLISNLQGTEANHYRESHPVSNLMSDLEVDVPPPKLQRRSEPKQTSWLQSALGLDSQNPWDHQLLLSEVIKILRWFVK